MIAPIRKRKSDHTTLKLLLKCKVHPTQQRVSHNYLVTTAAVEVEASVPIMRQFSSFFLHLLGFIYLDLLFETILIPIIGQLQLLVKMPHANIYDDEGNDSYEKHQVILNEFNHRPSNSKKITNGNGVDREEPKVCIKHCYARYLKKEGPNCVSCRRHDQFYGH